jgi:hypothetical protein
VVDVLGYLQSTAPRNSSVGRANTFLGVNAGNFTMTGQQNTATGTDTLFRNTTGSENTATGNAALFSNTTGFQNTATGSLALFDNTTGTNNTATGWRALAFNSTGGFNTATGARALFHNIGGIFNTGIGYEALVNTTGGGNTALGHQALLTNTTGAENTAIGDNADVSTGGLSNATAIGWLAIVDASNKIRLGNTSVTRIEGQVGFSSSSDVTRKERFQPVDGETVLRKLREFVLTSWNFIGHDPTRFRHYGPSAQEVFAAFGHDGVGTIGTPTTITSTDLDGILMIAVQALERRTAEVAELKERLEAPERGAAEFKAETAELKARLEAVERRLMERPVATTRRVP